MAHILDSQDSLCTDFDEFSKNVASEILLTKVFQRICTQTKITIDYLFFLLTASFISVFGFFQEDTILLVASMLVSPLNGPIVGLSLIHI